MGEIAYVPTTWVNDSPPALSAANLNHLTDEIASLASATGISESLPTWVDDSTPALTEAPPLNEIERVLQAVAAAVGVSYTRTTWSSGWTPARNAARLNYLEERVQACREAYDAGVPTVLGVDRRTMLATGGTIAREDDGDVSSPTSGLWGLIDAVNTSRYTYYTSGGDPRTRCNGTAQANSAYRRMTVNYGDETLWGNNARAELGRNESRYGENTGTQTSGTFALFPEGEHSIIFWSQRYTNGFITSSGNWQCVMQAKQAQPYYANGPNNGGPAVTVNVRSNLILLSGHNLTDYWTTPAPPLNTWIRYALEAYWSSDPTKGWIKFYVDRDGDGDFLDSDEYSGLIDGIGTLAYCTSAGYGYAVGDPIPGHLRLGIYHHVSYPTCSVEIDNVQIVR